MTTTTTTTTKQKTKKNVVAYLLGLVELHALAGEVGAGLLDFFLELGRREVGVAKCDQVVPDDKERIGLCRAARQEQQSGNRAGGRAGG